MIGTLDSLPSGASHRSSRKAFEEMTKTIFSKVMWGGKGDGVHPRAFRDAGPVPDAKRGA